MLKVGKIGKLNQSANKKLKAIFEEKGITRCEIGFNSCLGSGWLSFCHKHPREWYRSNLSLLSDFNEVLLGCINCHTELDDRSCTTEEEKDLIFKQRRG